MSLTDTLYHIVATVSIIFDCNSCNAFKNIDLVGTRCGDNTTPIAISRKLKCLAGIGVRAS
ncbi:hypothetical protein TSUD_218550 [Trifolium subterraneum]|uniref:Uncharacterized protein n=1 Tax=Trifolium subterraneum TaxID=3900 RepID=A0A2Z6MKB1_TRISU|nr:hypothetical protein TSUD_218550 [Trifolium subterraneum]